MTENSLALDTLSEPALTTEPAATAPRRTLPIGFLVRLTVSATLAGILLANSDLAAIRSSLAHLDARFWAGALAVYLFSQATSAYRWCTLGRAVGFQHSYAHYLKLYLEGMFFSLCLPSSIGGDVVKAMRLGTSAGQRFLAAGTVFADRLTGLTALAVICATGFVARTWAIGAAATLFLGAGVLLCALLSFVFVQWSLRRNAARLEKIPKLGVLFAELNIYNERPAVIFRAIAWSFMVQFSTITMVWCLGRGIGLELPTESYFVAVPVVSLASTLPLSINGVGVREGGLALILRDDGLTEEQGVALGLLWFSITLASGLIGGLAFLWDTKKQGTN